MKCCICGKECENEYGNNPYPLFTGEKNRCCDKCNDSYVLYARLNRITPNDKEEIEKVLNIMEKELKKGEYNDI